MYVLKEGSLLSITPILNLHKSFISLSVSIFLLRYKGNAVILSKAFPVPLT